MNLATTTKNGFNWFSAAGLGLLIWALWLSSLPSTQMTYKIYTFAGNGEPGYSGDGGPALEAKFHHARGIAVDKAGNLYIADTENHRVRKIEVSTGYITTFAGCDNGKDKVCEKWEQWMLIKNDREIPATQLQLNMPSDVAIDYAGNLYILDHVGYRVYKVDTTGVIEAFAGNGNHGYSGDGGLAIEASINPTFGGISVDHQHNLYIADRFNHRIRKVDSNGIITTVVGNGKAGYSGDLGLAMEAQLNLPEDMVVDQYGNMYIADSYNHIIRKVDTRGIITTIAGLPEKPGFSGDDGPASKATFQLPIAVAIDNAGNLYVADFYNHRIRRLEKATNGYIVTTIAGNDKRGYTGDGGLPTEASLHEPEDIALVLDGDGNVNTLYINEKHNFRVRKLEWVAVEHRNILLILFILLGLVLLLSMVLYHWRFYFDPIVLKPSRLLITPLEQLCQAKDLLERTHRLQSSGVPVEWLDKAINFATLSNAERCAWLATRLKATEIAIVHAEFFQLQFSEAFPLRLNDNRCLVYFPSGDSTELKRLSEHKKDSNDSEITIVISLEPTQQTSLRPMAKNRENWWVVPSSRELTELLLSPNPTDIFARLLASQLKLTYISPYQTGGSINKDSIFFGREQILTQILHREQINYLVIGGRQVGKSSLLKKIERHYQNHPKVTCFYLSLQDESLRKLNVALGLAKNTPLPTLLEKLADVPIGERRLILIDEADQFIHREIADGYPTLYKFRSVSEERRCHFILAGFWHLYEASVLDYHSPVVNFGESIPIGALETEACQQLATEPMEQLGIRYASRKLVEKIITATGQRANLIAIVCNEMIKNLPNDRRVLNAQDVETALHSHAVEDALSSWTMLIKNEPTMSHLIRIIVYATIEAGEFILTEVMAVLNAHEFVYTTEQLTQSLKYMELAYIIQREKSKYRYCVPLFREMLLEQDVKALLEQELRG